MSSNLLKVCVGTYSKFKLKTLHMVYGGSNVKFKGFEQVTKKNKMVTIVTLDQQHYY